jgi:hypothetical protein
MYRRCGAAVHLQLLQPLYGTADKLFLIYSLLMYRRCGAAVHLQLLQPLYGTANKLLLIYPR